MLSWWRVLLREGKGRLVCPLYHKIKPDKCDFPFLPLLSAQTVALHQHKHDPKTFIIWERTENWFFFFLFLPQFFLPNSWKTPPRSQSNNHKDKSEELSSKSSFSALGAQLLSFKSQFQVKNVLCDAEPSDFPLPGGLSRLQQIFGGFRIWILGFGVALPANPPSKCSRCESWS